MEGGAGVGLFQISGSPVPDLTGMRLAVAGAGVFGLCVALRAAWTGASVEVWDPAPRGDNASGVAAGMIAPAGELVFDRQSVGRFDLFRTGRDRWTNLAARTPGLSVDRSGATFLFPDDAGFDGARAKLNTVGVEGVVKRGASTRTGAAAPAALELHVSDDWRLHPPSALLALSAALRQAGGRFVMRSLDEPHLGAFDAVVLAAGLETRAFGAAAPELVALLPVKGQLVRFPGARLTGPILRTADIYIAPQPDGVLAGATMEAGRSDRVVEAQVIQTLRARALALAPGLAGQPFEGLAGVRASTPDGLPLAGPSSRPGLFLATGARRNGWLLAPLVSQIVVSYLSGGDGGPFAAALDPRRVQGA